jgi:hypothetical protein
MMVVVYICMRRESLYASVCVKICTRTHHHQQNPREAQTNTHTHTQKQPPRPTISHMHEQTHTHTRKTNTHTTHNTHTHTHTHTRRRVRERPVGHPGDGGGPKQHLRFGLHRLPPRIRAGGAAQADVDGSSFLGARVPVPVDG